jgi:H+/Cl- antiporter ClcA
MQEESIFDKEFERSLLVRRKKIMPFLLKAYIWMGIALGVVLGGVLFPAVSDQVQPSAVFYICALGFVITIVGAYILKYVLLLLEVKSAIRWNWWVGGFWNLFLILVFVNAEPDSYIYIIVQLVVSVPYWVMLFKIQRKWEHQAVSRKGFKSDFNRKENN